MSRDDRDDVPTAMSSRSTSPTRRPRVAASSAAPEPTIPPPTTSTSSGSSTSAARSRPRASSGSAVIGRGDPGARDPAGSPVGTVRPAGPADAPQDRGGAGDQDHDEERRPENDVADIAGQQVGHDAGEEDDHDHELA